MPEAEDFRAAALPGTAVYDRSRGVRTIAEDGFSEVLGQSRPVHPKAIEMGAERSRSVHRRRPEADQTRPRHQE